MTVPAPVRAAVRSFLRAQLTGDLALLTSVCRPHPALASLVPARPPLPAVAPLLAETERVQVAGTEVAADRWVARVGLGGVVHVLPVQCGAGGALVDPRYAIEALRPDDERRQVARRFYLAMLLADARALHELAFDARGVELLAGQAPPPGEHAQLAQVAATMGLVQLGAGESFVVPRGVEFVGPRHAEMGIDVFSALTPDAELPLLLRRRDGAWRVIAFHFIQAAAQARGGSFA
jgi:hypothetical protein